jgi:hypothetical protein
MFKPSNLCDTSAKTTIEVMDDRFFALARETSIDDSEISIYFNNNTPTYRGILANKSYIETNYLGLGWGECRIELVEPDMGCIKITLVKKPLVPLTTNSSNYTMRILERIQRNEEIYVSQAPENPWWKRALNWICNVDDPKDKPTKVKHAGKVYWEGVVVFDEQEATPKLGELFTFTQDNYLYRDMYLTESAVKYSEYQTGKKYFAYSCHCVQHLNTYQQMIDQIADLKCNSLEASFVNHKR